MKLSLIKERGMMKKEREIIVSERKDFIDFEK